MTQPAREAAAEPTEQNKPTELNKLTEPTQSTELSTSEYSSHYARLAKRLTGWTTNLLATAVVLLLAIAGGRELVSWWRADALNDSVSQEQSTAAAWTLPGDSFELEFGESPFSFQRDAVRGELSDALQRIRNRCREALASGAIPTGDVGPAELKLLRGIVDRQPIERTDRWRIFQTEQPMPLVLGIRDDCENTAATGKISTDEQTHLDLLSGKEKQQISRSRLVVWGLAVPATDGWTTYTCRSVEGVAHSGDLPSVQLPLPADCRKTLAIHDLNSGKLVGFRGGDLKAAIEFFDRWAHEHRWQARHDWETVKGVTRAEFEFVEVWQEQRYQSRIEIQMAGDQRNSSPDLSGLITLKTVQLNENH
jgi:hypothetical protein